MPKLKAVPTDVQQWLEECPAGKRREFTRKLEGVGAITFAVDRRTDPEGEIEETAIDEAL